jgi:hypothetical protein
MVSSPYRIGLEGWSIKLLPGVNVRSIDAHDATRKKKGRWHHLSTALEKKGPWRWDGHGPLIAYDSGFRRSVRIGTPLLAETPPVPVKEGAEL